jgi:hypothetical protein
MSRIKHAYDHDKDRMKISIRGYSLSKITRDEILENLIMQIERSPETGDRCYRGLMSDIYSLELIAEGRAAR